VAESTCCGPRPAEVAPQLGYREPEIAAVPEGVNLGVGCGESHGGSFGCDFVVAKVLKGPSERLNRVFTMSFPDRGARNRFFADPRYREVRVEPAVAHAIYSPSSVETVVIRARGGTKVARGSNFGSRFSRMPPS
jgi:hypothetical protein